MILSLEQNFEYGKKLRQISHEKKTHLGNSCVTIKYLINKFYETNELSDVIYDECSKGSGTEQIYNFESKQSVVSAPMQLRISLQRTEYNVETDSFCKNKTKIALAAQYFLSCPNNTEVIYVLVSIKYHIGNDLDQGHYICDVLD